VDAVGRMGSAVKLCRPRVHRSALKGGLSSPTTVSVSRGRFRCLTFVFYRALPLGFRSILTGGPFGVSELG